MRARSVGLMVVTALVVAACATDERQRVEPRASQGASEMPQTEAPATPPPIVTHTVAEAVARQESERIEVSAQRRAAVAYDSPIAVATMHGPLMPAPVLQHHVNTERYAHSKDNPVRLTSEHPVSTFSVDVDTGAYANVRRFLNEGVLPPQDAVRVEEMLNYFDYDYRAPSTRAEPFAVTTELAPAPWNDKAQLLRVGIKAYELPQEKRPPANLVFLIDVSGSMQSPDKLPLLKNSFRLLTEQLSARDRVGIVVYAGSSGVVLEPTAGDQKYRIREAIDRLEAGGSTNGGEGIERAYQLARAHLIRNGVNRVILATDGDFNVGNVSFDGLVDMAERERKSGVALTTLGFGRGNYNDHLLERLADAGDGNHAYVDNLSEARKVLVTQLSSTLVTVAKDVKIQIEFNPAEVQEYRLIGYENRMLAREDFNNDAVDAGEIGAGHRVTALYEIIPAGASGRIDPLRYGEERKVAKGSGELAWLRLRYKQPEEDRSKLIERAIRTNEQVTLERASADFRFAASVAAFGQWLRGGKYLNGYDCEAILGLARAGLGNDAEGYRREFVSLVSLAQALGTSSTPQDAPAAVGQVQGR